MLEIRPTQRRKQWWRAWLPFLGVFICVISAVGLAIVLTILSEAADADNEDTDQNTIVYGLTLLPSGFDPHIHRSAELGIPLYSVYDTLIYRHPQTHDFVAGLAEDWEISADGLRYTFFLRQDVSFHDGTRFDANAVGVTLDRIAAEETRSSKALPLLGPYQGYAILDEHTIQIILAEPYSALLDALSQPYLGIASPTALANHNDATYQYHQVGTGPFRMVEYVNGDRFVVERNPDYNWGPRYYSDYTDSSVDRVIFRFYEQPSTRRIGLEAGDVDLVGELPPTDAELLLRNQDYRLHLQPIPGMPLQFFMNTQRFPTSELGVRQGLLYATHRETIVSTIFFDQFNPTAYGPLSASTLYYDPTVQDLYQHSLEQAETYFATAGVTDSDGDSILDIEGRPLELKIVFMGFGFLPEVAQLIESQWREVGLEVELVQVGSFATLMEYARNGDFNLIAFNDFGFDPSLLNRYYLSSGDSNWTGYADPELDAWLVEAAQSIDPAVRQPLYTNIQKRIMDQALVLPIRDYVNIVGVRSDIDGLVYAAQGWWPLLTNLVVQQ